MKKSIWVGLSGMPGSGKTTIAQKIEKRLTEKGYVCAIGKISDIIRKETQKSGLALTRQNIYKVGQQARNEAGEAIWAQRFINYYFDQEADVIIVDGIRLLSELKEFREVFGKYFILLALDVEQDILISRIVLRGRIEDEVTKQDPSLILEEEIKLGVVDCMRKADFTLQNNGVEILLEQSIIYLLSLLSSINMQGEQNVKS